MLIGRMCESKDLVAKGILETGGPLGFKERKPLYFL